MVIGTFAGLAHVIPHGISDIIQRLVAANYTHLLGARLELLQDQKVKIGH